MAAAARRVYVVADHTKLGRTALAKFGNLADFDGLITDASADPGAVRKLRAAGVVVTLAGKHCAAARNGAAREVVAHG
jgi:DeoR/GlpR family transcriptional regulator of sugar metabolism